MNLLPWRQPVELLMLISHKVLRLFLPIFMILGYATNVVVVLLAPHWLYFLLLTGQTAILALALFGAIAERLGFHWRPASIMWYFLASKVGSLVGLVRFLGRRQTHLWTRVRRQEP
jgi:hypothetical protein